MMASQKYYEENIENRYAIIRLPNGDLISGTFDNYELCHGGVVKIRINNTTYLTHFNNVVVLMKTGKYIQVPYGD